MTIKIIAIATIAASLIAVPAAFAAENSMMAGAAMSATKTPAKPMAHKKHKKAATPAKTDAAMAPMAGDSMSKMKK